MTPEEILQDLRDIHLPGQAVDAGGGGFVFWPVALVVAVVLLTGWLAWQRRSAWRRDIIRHLDAIEQGVDEGHILEGWTELATLLRRIAIRLCDRQEIAGLIGDAWLNRLDRLFKTDIFARGPGRGIVVFPYNAIGDEDRDDLERIADQLRLTIDDMRKHLPHLKVGT